MIAALNPEPNQITALPDYETKSQVARRLNVSRRTIDNLMRQRRLPFIKLTSKIVRFPKAEVEYAAERAHPLISGGGRERIALSWQLVVELIQILSAETVLETFSRLLCYVFSTG